MLSSQYKTARKWEVSAYLRDTSVRASACDRHISNKMTVWACGALKSNHTTSQGRSREAPDRIRRTSSRKSRPTEIKVHSSHNAMLREQRYGVQFVNLMIPSTPHLNDTASDVAAPAGGAAAAAPERGALAGPSAPTSTSTRWALVTP
jgi:hypothetical protein